MALHCLISHIFLNSHVTFYHLPLFLKKKTKRKTQGKEVFKRDGGGVRGSTVPVLEALLLSFSRLHALM